MSVCGFWLPPGAEKAIISLSRAALTLIPRHTDLSRVTVCPPEVMLSPERTYSLIAQLPMPFISIFLQDIEEFSCAVTVEFAKLSMPAPSM